MPNKPNAPLIYTIGLVRFPAVPDVDRFMAEFHDAIRTDYPLADVEKVQTLMAAMGPHGLSWTQGETTLHQFADVKKNFAFFVGPDCLGLHTIKYVDHVDFALRFHQGLKALTSIPTIAIKWTLSLGLRYVDLIVPREGETLDQYLPASGLDPVNNSTSLGLKVQTGAFIAAYESKCGIIRMQIFRNPPGSMPVDLENGFVIKNQWGRKRPEGDFAVLDIDHGTAYPEPIPMDPDGLKTRLIDLRDVTSSLFHSVSSTFAQDVWENVA